MIRVKLPVTVKMAVIENSQIIIPHASCILLVPAFVYRDKREVIMMTTFEIAQFWWLLPLLMILVCCIFCCKGCCGTRKSKSEVTERNPLQRL